MEDSTVIRVPLSGRHGGGKFMLVDAEDIMLFVGRKVYLNGRYPSIVVDGKAKSVHRALMNPTAQQAVDHVNGDSFDNRRSNLRVCSFSENAWNTRPHRRGSSQFKGVSWCKRKCQWHAKINAHRVVYNIGYFDDEAEAAHAYDKKARELHGEFAYLNFPEERR